MKKIKRTKIVCTIGPATSSKEKIAALIKAGMNVARLNFSHGTHQEHARLIKIIRAEARKLDAPIAILQDLQGPKIRVGEMPKEGLELKASTQIIFTTGKGDFPKKIPVTYKKLHEDVKPGERLLLDDGLLSVKVKKVVGRDIFCEVIDGGLLTSHKGLNLPESRVSVSAISEKDKEDLRFGVAQHVDWVALSFVRSSKEILDLRSLIKKYEYELGGLRSSEHPIKIIAKIEKREAVQTIDEIIKVTDAIMVARGDLGIEMQAQEVPLIQKGLIDKCLLAAKPVIVATQMLDSMIRNPRPTRAEVSDIANAVIDHADAIMLSGETANGKYPIESLQTMVKVVLKTEASIYDDMDQDHFKKKIATTEEAVSEVAKILAMNVKAHGVLVVSINGDTGRMVSRYRPEIPIYMITDNSRVSRQLFLSWGVVPFELPRCRSLEKLVERSIEYLKKNRRIKRGEKLIVVAGEPLGIQGKINLVEIREVV